MPLSRPGFTELVQRFVAFDYKGTDEQLVFRGSGTVAGPAWQRAILTWTHWTVHEAFGGQICAACRTVMSWNFWPAGENSTQCTHLTVLDYGYAYAQAVPCGGGAARMVATGWLETNEWEQIDQWVTQRTEVYQGDNYLAGQGAAPMNDAELEQLEELAQSIYGRLSP